MPATKEQSDAVDTIDFHYRRSPHYRTVRADGATGGISPHSEIQMSFYGDYAADPEMLSHEINAGGLGKETGRIQHKGIIREVEFTMTMSVPVAEAMVVWMQERIKEARGLAEPVQGGH